MIPYPHPDLPDLLHKYLSFDGLKKTLLGSSVLVSRPTLFNDAFDSTPTYGSDFDRETVVESALEQCVSVVRGDEFPKLVGPFAPFLLMLRSTFGAKRFVEDELRAGLEDTLDGLPAHLSKLKEEHAEHLKSFKICCFSSDSLSPPMWGNYADNLNGGMLSFSHDETRDSLFLTARPVLYKQTPPILFSNDFLSDYLSARAEITPEYLTDLAIFNKDISWKYEQEWRLVAGEGWKPEYETELVNFNPLDLSEVTLGARASQDQINETKHILRIKYPHTRLFRLTTNNQSSQYLRIEIDLHY